MAAPLTEFAKEQQRPMNQFVWSERLGTCEIWWRIAIQNGDKCMSQRKVYGCVGTFERGWTGVDARTWRPSIEIDQRIRDNRRIRID